MDHDDDFANRTYPIKENMARERRAWQVEHVGFYALLLLVLLTLLGLFSNGPLSTVTVASEDGALRVEYERFSRNGAEENMVITAKGRPGQPLQVTLGARFLEGVAIEAMQPASGPAHTHGRDLVVPLQADEHGDATLYLTLRSNGAWLYRSEVGLSTGTRVAVPKFIYP